MLFAPDDLTLVKGDPSDRRKFLDDLLLLRTPRLGGVRADYDRVLKQRNALLKTARLARGKAIETLDVWDGHLTDLGGQLLAARRRGHHAPEIARLARQHHATLLGQLDRVRQLVDLMKQTHTGWNSGHGYRRHGPQPTHYDDRAGQASIFLFIQLQWPSPSTMQMPNLGK